MNRLKKILSSHAASIIAVTAALAGRCLLQIHFALPDGDKAFQVQAAQNFLDGHGLTILKVYANDLSQPHFVPLVKWPPGYSFFLMPFLLLCKNDFFLATILLDIATAVLFIFFSRRLLSKFHVPVYWLNIYTLVTGFFIYEFCTASTSDFLTLTIYIAALLCTLSIIQSRERSLAQFFLLALLLFLAGFTRFMFIPIAFIVPVYLIANGYFNKNKFLLKKGLTVFIMLAFFMATFLILQKSYAGAATYLTTTEKGFYPDHLLRLYPFGFSAIFNTNLVCVQLAKITGLSFSIVYELLTGIHFCLFAVLIFLVVRWIFKKNYKTTLINHYLYIGAITAGIIVLLLAFLSLTNKLVTEDWSFIQEGRYFAFLTFFLQQFLFLILIRWGSLLASIKKIIIYGTFSILSLSCMHGAYFVVKAITAKKYSDETAKSIKVMRFSDSLIYKLIHDHPGQSFVISSQNVFVNNFSAIKFKAPGLYDTSSIFRDELRTKKETGLIIVRKQPSERQDMPGAKEIGEIEDNYFYIVNVMPDGK